MSLKDKRLKHMEKWEGKIPTTTSAPAPPDVSLGQTTSRRAKRSKTNAAKEAPSKSVNIGRALKLSLEYLMDTNGATYTYDELVNKALTLKKPDEESTIYDSDESNQQAILDELKKVLLTDVTARGDFLVKLKENSRIDVSGQDDNLTFTYKSTYKIRDPQSIINLLRETQPAGVDSKELKDGYKGVEDDLTKLKNEGRVYFLKNKEQKSDVLFYKDPALVIEIDAKLKAAWGETKRNMPPIADLEEKMRQANIKPIDTVEWLSDAAAQKRRLALEEENRGKKKARKQRKITRVTNEHMVDTIDFNEPN
jgi:predicted transcriptional regulator